MQIGEYEIEELGDDIFRVTYNLFEKDTNYKLRRLIDKTSLEIILSAIFVDSIKEN